MITVVETPEDMQQLMRECIQITYEYIEQANKKFGLYLPKFRVVFSLKSRTAGKARLNRGIIEFNPTLLRENPQRFLARTPGHEVIHFAAFHKHGDNGHGPDWKRMMREMGLPDTRCHSFDTSNVPTQVGKRANPRKNDSISSDLGVIRTVAVGKIIEFD